MTTTPQTETQRLADFAKQLSDEGPMIHTLSWPQLSGACQMFSDELRRLDSENSDLRERNAALGNAQEIALDTATEHALAADELRSALTAAEAERDQLRAQLAKAVAEEREACALECESRQANGNRTNTHPDECAAAIRARSNT